MCVCTRLFVCTVCSYVLMLVHKQVLVLTRVYNIVSTKMFGKCLDQAKSRFIKETNPASICIYH